MHYLHLDVFTDRPFEGNQLAVFTRPPADITPGTMQAIAREMNFSESTFIFPPDQAGDGRARMRIFTPGAELPMAGHPTIGSVFALAAEGAIAPGRTDFVFELGVGPTPVSLEWAGGRLDFVWMTQLLPAFGETVPERRALAAAAGLDDRDLVPDLPLEVVSCGVPYLLIPLVSREAVDRASLDRRAFRQCCERAGTPEVPAFFFTLDTSGRQGDETVYSRMLAPGFGITEDPATGSASGPLGCYLVHHEVLDAAAARRIISLQGAAMGRPGRIHVCIDSQDGGVSRVRVGGRAVTVGRGDLLV